MKAKEVLKILRVTRTTLTSYVNKGLIEIVVMGNGRYDYVDESVYNFINKSAKRKTVLYARVSTIKQKRDLSNQIDLLKQYCLSSGFEINEIYSDVASGISFDKRDDFFKMIDEIIAGRIEKVVISYKDRMSRVGFELFNTLFNKFGAKIIVVSEIGSTKLDSEEIFEEIVSLLHCYSMKLYSKRKDKKIKEILSN